MATAQQPTPDTQLPILAEVWRGHIVESVHHGAWAETDGVGKLLEAVGDPELVTTLRSAAKPLQALPLVVMPGAADLDINDEELAICCASHPGTPRHAALVASVLALSGYLPDDLVCPPAGDPPSRLKHGCSGNHAAILLAAHLLRVPLAGYERPDHPAETLIRNLIVDFSNACDIRLATDGCGVPTYGMRLREMACAFAALTRKDEPWNRIPRVMAEHTELIGAEDWIDVRLMRATNGRIIAKTGAEGLLCLGLRDQGRGLAVKIADGSARALGVVAIAALLRAGWLTESEAAHPLLADLRRPRYFAPDGLPIAEIRPTA